MSDCLQVLLLLHQTSVYKDAIERHLLSICPHGSRKLIRHKRLQSGFFRLEYILKMAETKKTGLTEKILGKEKREAGSHS